jgi:glyoxylate/hydroxypyruvate reductase A|tara:strand:+ start:696 stop:1616 length:921 start_codon:yes stop_codon:yes gene_type:complete
MNLLIITQNNNIDKWLDIFSKTSNCSVEVWPNVNNYNKIDCVALWSHPHGLLNKFKNLKLIHSMGAGVDHILSDPSLPSNIPICRISDEKLSFSMSNYIIMAVLYFHKRLDKYKYDRKHKIFDHDSYPEIDVNIGILGYGSLGSDAGNKLKGLGFNVYGYSLNKKNENNIPLFYGDDLDIFLKKINVLVCTVPYTSKTKKLLSMKLFEKLNNGTYLINVSRGKVQNESDILEAIDKGILSGAFLDVFTNEPLPKNSLIWKNENIQITPHIASITNEEAAVPQILNNYQRLTDNLSLFNKVNTDNEY